MTLRILSAVRWIRNRREYPTTMGPPTTTVVCNDGDSKIENCRVMWCSGNHWQPFEFTATYECCKTSDHPKCKYIFVQINNKTDENLSALLRICKQKYIFNW